QLLERLEGHYAHLASSESRLRTIQRDLKSLTEVERIEVVDSTAKPLRYRRRTDADGDGPGVQEYILEIVQDALGNSLSKQHIERIWPRLMSDKDRVDLSDDK